MIWVIIANLIALSVLMYLVGKLSEIEGREGFMYSVYPWINTFPETLSTALLLIGGYSTAALYNSIFSAAFDAAFGIGLAALIHGTISFAVTDLVFITVVSGVVFMIFDFDGMITISDAAMLYMFLIFATVYSIARYGFLRKRLSKIEVIKVVSGLAALGVITYIFYTQIESLIPYIGERLGGVVSAALTSVPDLITAIVYGLASTESQAELLGCIAHDFIENVPTSVLAAYMIAGSSGMIDVNPIKTLIITGLTVSSILFVASFRRVTRFEGALLILVFIIAVVLVL